MTETLFAPPVQRALRSDVYDALRRAIITGAISSGQRINETEIGRQMQISRAPIREAIRVLEQEGLLESVPRRGTFVVSLSSADIEEVYTLRADIEARAIRRALPRLEAEHFEILTSLVDRMLIAAEGAHMTTLLDLDLQFHRTLVELADWPRLRKIWESLHPQTLTLYTLTTLTEWPPQMHAQRHLPVLQALQSRDADLAAEAITEHILGVGRRLILRAGGEPSVPGHRRG